MTTGDKALAAFVAVLGIGLVAGLVFAIRQDHQAEQQRIEKLKQTMSHYRSPVERTDAQRLDWLTAHPTLAPWTVDGTDPRREIDYAMDQEQEAQP